MIRFQHIFNDIDNHAKFQIITLHMQLEYSINGIENLEALRDNLNEVIEGMKEVEQLDEKERIKKWLDTK